MMRSPKRKNKGIEPDFISKLPDDVLSNIISRLEVEDAVQTSILSSRWKYLWTLINNLKFRSHPELHSQIDLTPFVDFVEHVLFGCESKNIKEFHLQMKNVLVNGSDAARIENFISWVLARNVQTLTLNFVIASGGPVFRLPQSIFTCRSLERLTLDRCDPVVDVPESTVCFPNLKFLSIFFEDSYPDYPKKLLDNCPVLEELIIKEFWVCDLDDDNNLETLHINIPSLRKLKLDLVNEIDKFRCVIRAPNLEFLCVLRFSSFLLMGEYPRLNKIIPHEFPILVDDGNCFVKAISWPKCLLFSSVMLKFAINYLLDKLSLFSNLVHVYIEFELNTPSLAIKFLRYMPNVEHLVLHNKECKSWYLSEAVKEYELEPLDNVPSCMLSRLKKVHFINAKLTLLELVKYILENSKVLESFSARVIGTTKLEKTETKKEIDNFPRASSVCRIGFFNSKEMGKIRDSWYEGWSHYD